MVILALLAGGYLAICLLVFFRQDAMIFHPSAATDRELADLAAADGFEPWRNARGERIGWRSPAGDPARALLVFHGNGGSALGGSYHPLRPPRGEHEAFQIYLLEYPGYGNRPGPPSAKLFTAAAVEAVDLLSADPARRIWLMGQSMGTGVACAAAAARPEKIAGLALVTPYDSLSGAASAHYPWLPVRLLMRHRLDSDQNLTRYHGPVAFVIAGRDDTIPPRLGQELFAGYTGPKRLWLVPEAGHNDLDELLADWPRIAAWLVSSKPKTGNRKSEIP